MIDTEKFRSIYDEVNNSRIDESFYKGTSIGVICGPSIIVEMVVKNASLKADVPMDWHYSGGRGIVYAKGSKEQIKKAVQELEFSIPRLSIDTII